MFNNPQSGDPIKTEVQNAQIFCGITPPNAKDIPLPQSLVDSNIPASKNNPFKKHPMLIGRTPCKNIHRNKAMDAIQKIVDESDEATAGSRKNEARNLRRERRRTEKAKLNVRLNGKYIKSLFNEDLCENSFAVHRKTENKSTSVKDLTSIELICKIMADRSLREEAQRCQPDLYEEMISIMVESISIP